MYHPLRNHHRTILKHVETGFYNLKWTRRLYNLLPPAYVHTSPSNLKANLNIYLNKIQF
jgi:hypothetical protein